MAGSREEPYVGPELNKRIDQITKTEVEDAMKRGYKRSRSAVLRMLLLKGVEEWERKQPAGEKQRVGEQS